MVISLSGDYYIFPIGVLIVLIWALFLLHPLGTGYRRAVDHVDVYHHTWNLWWGYYSIWELFQNPYFTNYNGYPVTIPLYFHQLILPLGFLSAPLFWIGLNSSQVLLFWQYLFLFVGYVGMYWLIRYFGGTGWGALAAGIYFSFSPIVWQDFSRPDALSFLIFPWFFLTLY